MARRVAHETRSRQIYRNGVLYEFHRDATYVGGRRVTEFLACRWNGYRWVVLHRFTV